MAEETITVNKAQFELAHNLASQTLMAVLQSKQMKVNLNPEWFTDKVRETCKALARARLNDPEMDLHIGVELGTAPNALAVMSGRTSPGVWEVVSYYSSREEADAAHKAIAEMGGKDV